MITNITDCCGSYVDFEAAINYAKVQKYSVVKNS